MTGSRLICILLSGILVSACGCSEEEGVVSDCGDGRITGFEECDGDDLGAASCQGADFAGGDLRCTPLCALDTSGCCSDACDPAATRCSGSVVERCEVGESGCLAWAEGEDCAVDGEVCSETGAAASCQGVCADGCPSEGALRCTGAVLEICAPSVDGCLDWMTDANCAATGAVCDASGGAAACTSGCGAPCATAGETRCTGDAVETCTAGAGGCIGWAQTSDCASAGERCDDTSGTATCVTACTSSCSVEGETRCTGDALEICSVGAGGCRAWTLDTDCTAVAAGCLVVAGTAGCACSNRCTDGAVECNGDVLRTCGLNGFGCPEWTDTDCAASGELCWAATGTPRCAALAGEACSTAWALSEGPNSVDWVALSADHVTSPTSCIPPNVVLETDLILSYTAQATGYVDIAVENPASAPLSLIVADGPCGDTSSELHCEWTRYTTLLGGVIPVVGGTTYHLYVSDTSYSNQTGTLPNPLDVTVRETPCAGGADAHQCSTVGEERCRTDVDVTRSVDTRIFGTTDGGCSGFGNPRMESITIVREGTVRDVDVLVDIDHTRVTDVELFLQHRDADGNVACVALSQDNGGDGDDFSHTLFDDEAATAITAARAPFEGPHQPEGSLSDFDGFGMAGVWTLYLGDDGAGPYEGILREWGLSVAYDGEGLEACSVGADGCRAWTDAVDCADTGQRCSDAAGPAACGACGDDCPVVGERRCTGDVSEICAVGGQGCTVWTVDEDCTASTTICVPTTGLCEAPRGEDCATSIALAFGDNVVDHAIAQRDYVTDTCGYGETDTPDLVLDYTPDFTGVAYFLASGAIRGFHQLLVSDAACGDLTAPICEPGGAVPVDVVAGVPVNLYVVAYPSGEAIADPLTVRVSCIDACAAGAQRCHGVLLEDCVVGARGCAEWITGTDCTSVGACDPNGGAPACAVCADECASAGDSQCNGDVIETCQSGSLGCLEWTAGTDCSAGGDFCSDAAGTASCVTPTGEGCASALSLVDGVNVLDWSAGALDYLTTPPACVVYGGAVGPDVVAAYVSTFDGPLQVVLSKPADEGWFFVVSDGACGDTTTELACGYDISEIDASATLDVQAGETYTFYFAGTEYDASPLADPLTVTLGCLDECTSGAERCNGDVAELCGTNPAGCLSWATVSDCGASSQRCDASGASPVCNVCPNDCTAAGSTRCVGEELETCVDVGSCLEWQPSEDCAAGGELCDAGAAPNACAAPRGEDCSTAITLTEGDNAVDWLAASLDYVDVLPSCVPAGRVPGGPDLVLEYTTTSASAGFVSVAMGKADGERVVLAASDAACGTLVPEAGCFANPQGVALEGTFPVVGGTPYRLYAFDTIDGSIPLDQPLSVEITETDCAGYAATVVSADPPSGGLSITRTPRLTVTFDEPVDPSQGSIVITGGGGASATFDLSLTPPEITFSGGDRTLHVDPGLTFAEGETVTVSWSGLRDVWCGNAVPDVGWSFGVPVPACQPGVGGMVGTTVTRVATAASSVVPYYVVPDQSPSGFVYVGDISRLYRTPKAGGTTENVVTLAGGSSSRLGYAMVIAGQEIFTLNNDRDVTSGLLWRWSTNGGTSWQLDDYASFSAPPNQRMRAAASDGARLHMMTNASGVTGGTEIWSVPLGAGTLPVAATLDVVVPSEVHCNGLAVDALYYYVACVQPERLVRVNRTNAAVTLITTMYELSTWTNALHLHDTVGADGVGDVLYLNHGTEDALYFCDPDGAPFTDLLANYGPSWSNGLGFDAAAGVLWGFDDDTRELVKIE